MKDSKLIKDFKTGDVQRMRNLITKKYSDRTTTQVGYQKSLITRIEGDEWEENGKKWTIKNGIKVTVTRLDNIKKLLQMPLVCPKCLKPMIKGNVDKKMYTVHQMCFDCVIDFEAKLKLEGKFDDYQKDIIKQGVKSQIREMEDLLLELSLKPSNESFVTEQGDIEEWQGKSIDNTTLIKDIQEYIEKLNIIITQ